MRPHLRERHRAGTEVGSAGDPHSQGCRRARADVEGEEKRVRGRGPDRAELPGPGRGDSAQRDRGRAPGDRRPGPAIRPAGGERLSRRRRQPAPAGALRRTRSGGGEEGGGNVGRDPPHLPAARRVDHGGARRRGGQGAVHGGDVHGAGPGDHAARPLRLRPRAGVQSRQDVSFAAAVRRQAGAVPAAPQRAVGRSVARVTPGSVDEVEALLAQGAGGSVLFVGGGTAMPPGPAVDTEISTGGLSRVVEYTPADQVVTVECGVTLAQLQGELGKNGQRLALDPPHPEKATVGGIVAANSFGPSRTRYGSVRDLIIGISVVRADGTRAKGGGKVVK